MRRALEITEERHAARKIQLVAGRMNNLAIVLQDTGRIEEAEPLMRRALQIDEATFGDQHPEVATVLNNLANLLKESDRIEEAEPMARRALEIAKTAFNDQHPTVATISISLAQILTKTSQFSEAELLLQRSLNILCLFAQKSGYEHRQFQQVKADYQALRDILGPNESG